MMSCSGATKLVRVAAPRRIGGWRSDTVLEAPALVAGLDDFAVVGEPVEQCGGHLGLAEDRWPFSERQVGGDDLRGLLVEAADQVEQQLASGLREGQIAQFIEHDEVEPPHIVGHTPLLAIAGLGLELVDQIDDVEEPPASPIADTGAGAGDGQMGLAGSGTAINTTLRSCARKLPSPGAGIATNRIIATVVAQATELLEQPDQRQLFPRRLVLARRQQPIQIGLSGADPRARLVLALILERPRAHPHHLAHLTHAARERSA